MSTGNTLLYPRVPGPSTPPHDLVAVTNTFIIRGHSSLRPFGVRCVPVYGNNITLENRARQCKGRETIFSYFFFFLYVSRFTHSAPRPQSRRRGHWPGADVKKKKPKTRRKKRSVFRGKRKERKKKDENTTAAEGD